MARRSTAVLILSGFVLIAWGIAPIGRSTGLAVDECLLASTLGADPGVGSIHDVTCNELNHDIYMAYCNSTPGEVCVSCSGDNPNQFGKAGSHTPQTPGYVLVGAALNCGTKSLGECDLLTNSCVNLTSWGPCVDPGIYTWSPQGP